MCRRRVLRNGGCISVHVREVVLHLRGRFLGLFVLFVEGLTFLLLRALAF